MSENPIKKLLFGSQEHYESEQRIRRERELHGLEPYRVRIGGLVGLLVKINERKNAATQRGGGAGSTKT